MDLYPIPTISLFAGSGMLDIAVEFTLERFGCRSVPLAFVERDSAAAAVILAWMEAKALGEAPICDSLESFDGTIFRPYMAEGILLASPPCQPYSSAGKREGNDDHRSHGKDGDGPLFHLARIIGEVRPAVVFFENVPEWITGGAFQRFGDELSNMGYSIEDPFFLAAEDVGAPHERERVFILAVAHANFSGVVGRHRNSDGEAGEISERRRWQNGEPFDAGKRSSGVPVANASRGQRRSRSKREQVRAGIEELAQRASDRLEGVSGKQQRDIFRRDTEGRSDKIPVQLDDSASARRDGTGVRPDPNGGGGECLPRDKCDLLPLFPAGRGDPENPDHPDWWAWAAIAEMDASRMPRVESKVSMVVDGMARADELRIGGNGVVPIAAALAFSVLLSRVLDMADKNDRKT